MSATTQLTPESLCDGLDQLCIQKLELMDQLIRSNMMLECNMRTGFFLLGKTRYSLGNKAISALQLPNEEREVDALTTAVTNPVPVQGYDGDILYHHVDAKFEDPIISVEENEEPPDEMSSDVDMQMDGLRRRHKNSEGIDDEEEESDTEEMNGTSCQDKKVKVINRDPIRWFSTLPPQTLRQAQSEFKTSLQMVSQCASLQLKLQSVSKEYKRLMKIKSKVDRLEKEP